MHRFYYIVFALLSCLATVPAQTDLYLQREIQKIITFDAEIDFKQTPGILVGLVWQDSARVFSYGVASEEDSLPLTASHIFELGELSHLFTASLAVKLARENLINLDSLRPYLNHTSGMPRFPPDFGGNGLDSNKDPYPGYTRDDLQAFLNSFQPPDTPSTGFLFSNLNYAFLELAIERALQKPYAQILQSELLDPLGMSATRVAGDGMISNAADLLRWMRHFLNPDDSWKAIFSELYRQPIPSGIRKNTWVGYGWHIIYPKKKFLVLAHTGSTGEHMAYMALAPQTRTGVVVLANSPHGVKGLGMLVLRMLNDNWKKR